VAGDDDVLSAEVVLHGPAGRRAAAVSAADLAEHQPDPATAAGVRRWFQERGFAATDVHGISLTLTGPRRLFDDTFGTRLAGGGARPGVDVVELPTPADLPGHLAAAVDAVTFSPPPAFGPGSP
jgi:hypothetical protein